MLRQCPLLIQQGISLENVTQGIAIVRDPTQESPKKGVVETQRAPHKGREGENIERCNDLSVESFDLIRKSTTRDQLNQFRGWGCPGQRTIASNGGTKHMAYE
jgi:hypothetical protein